MALSTNLQAAKDAIDAVSGDAHPTTYNQPIITKLVAALQAIITDVDALNNA